MSSEPLNIIHSICCYQFDDQWEISRKRENVMQRAVFYRLCKDLTTSSLQDIGNKIRNGKKGKDHATVLHGLRIFDELVRGLDGVTKRNEAFYDTYVYLKSKCKVLVEKHNIGKPDMMMSEILNLRMEVTKMRQLNENLSETLSLLVQKLG